MLILVMIAVLASVGAGCGGAEASSDAGVKRVAIILDDGPIPENTQAFIAVFSNANIRVNFALVASNVQAFKSSAMAIIAAGHEVANHSYSHRKPAESDAAQMEREIVYGQQLITETTGFTPKWYWPPFLETDGRMPAFYEKAGIKLFPLDLVVDSEDYDMSVSARGIRKRATQNIKDGSVIVFHEWRKETLQEMPAIIAELKRQNCVFMTFSELGAERVLSTSTPPAKLKE